MYPRHCSGLLMSLLLVVMIIFLLMIKLLMRLYVIFLGMVLLWFVNPGLLALDIQKSY